MPIENETRFSARNNCICMLFFEREREKKECCRVCDSWKTYLPAIAFVHLHSQTQLMYIYLVWTVSHMHGNMPLWNWWKRWKWIGEISFCRSFFTVSCAFDETIFAENLCLLPIGTIASCTYFTKLVIHRHFECTCPIRYLFDCIRLGTCLGQ